MPALIFDTCCGCIELRTGCLIVGYLHLVGDIILIIMGFIALLAGGVVTASANHDGKTDTEQVAAGTAIMVVSIIMLLILFFALALTIVLLVGVHQNKRGHIKAYLIFNLIFLIVYTIAFLAGLAQGPSAGEIVGKIVNIVLTIYFLLVIRSYFYKMDDPSKRPAIYNTA